ncbi:MAG: beta-propeller fold lactonase family protein [Chromatiales bacterium]|nr:beta-propeller fold lactonase family protein [Chromatiales bacterium]
MKSNILKTGALPTLLLAAWMPFTAQADSAVVGAVYTMSNEADGNRVLMFDRDLGGKLSPAGHVLTGGLGSGDGLGNQGAVILDPANRWLFVVNAGSNDISVFRVEAHGLTLIDQESSGGQRPISLTYAHNLLYVLNAGGAVGGSDNISGFHVAADGLLTPIPGSTRTLSAADTGAAQVSFNSDGDVLMVTEKATNLIDTFTVAADGTPGAINTFVSNGTVPFGFGFGKRNQVFVSEAASGSVSSYHVGEDGSLSTISLSVPTTEAAACWVVVSNDGRYAYTTNAGSDSISGYVVGFDGRIALLDANGVTGNTGKNTGPLDMVISSDGRNLYSLNGRSDTIGVFAIKDKGGLAAKNANIAVPATANGLAVR